MIERGLHGELVALAAPSLETYLSRVNAPDLLWQFYERNKNHAAAAKILDSLASKVGYVCALHRLRNNAIVLQTNVKINIHFLM